MLRPVRSVLAPGSRLRLPRTINILDAVGKAAFKSLGDAWADTTTPHGRLMLTVLGGLAEFERELILARTGDARARATSRHRNKSDIEAPWSRSGLVVSARQRRPAQER